MVKRFCDFVLCFLVIPSGLILKFYRRYGSRNFPGTTAMLRRIGVFPITDHYYEPRFIYPSGPSDASSPRTLPGIDLNTEEQKRFLATLTYSSELRELKLAEKSADVLKFHINNGSFESGDAEYLYQFIRAVKPGKVIEIGSGHSTKIASLARQRNQQETGKTTTHVCIEPYEMPWLERVPGLKVMRQRVEDTRIDWRTELAAGDLLFIDSSHVIRPQGDVLKEYLEILPQLAPGVFIHVHDVFTPRDYPRAWLADDVHFWNEQYLMEALLSGNTKYEIVGALNYLKHDFFDELRAACPYLTADREPGSFYFKVVAARSGR